MPSKSDPRRTPAAFAIRRVEIVKIGSVDYIDIPFHSDRQSLDLFYAGNGVGKTTVLEAMSLLGHLPCMPVQGIDGIRPSLLRRVLNQASGSRQPHAKLLNDRPISETTLEQWMVKLRDNNAPRVGAVRFVVTDCHDAQGNGLGSYSNSFIVLVQSGTTLNDAPLLTPLLSREGAGGVPLGDLSLEDHFLVVLDKSINACADFDELERRIARGRTFSLDGTTHRHFGDLIVSDQHRALAVGPSRRVSYINTDLNDFGRGNDLRESPKNIAESFDSEVIERFRVYFDPAQQHVYAKLDEMNSMLERVLSAASSNYGDVYAFDGGLRIMSFRRPPGATKADFKAFRGHGKTFSVEFMSAGENEVFFVLLLCQLMSPKGSERGLILLDEPDLHIANPMRAAFFESILDVTGNGTQLVVCTHSPVALDVLRRRAYPLHRHIRVLYRRYISDDAVKTELKIGFDPRYLSKLRTKFAGVSAPHRAALLYRNLRMGLLGFWMLPVKAEKLREWIGHGLTLATITLFLVGIYATVIALLNDVFNVTGASSEGLLFNVSPNNVVMKLLAHKTVQEVHDEVRSIAINAAFALLCLAIVQGLMHVWRIVKRRQLKMKAISNAGTV